MNRILGVAALFVVSLRLVLGGLYVADCRQVGGIPKDCWAEGYEMSGFESLGLAAGGFLAGFWTHNPALDRN
jgi:hypothetical protein